MTTEELILCDPIPTAHVMVQTAPLTAVKLNMFVGKKSDWDLLQPLTSSGKSSYKYI